MVGAVVASRHTPAMTTIPNLINAVNARTRASVDDLECSSRAYHNEVKSKPPHFFLPAALLDASSTRRTTSRRPKPIRSDDPPQTATFDLAGFEINVARPSVLRNSLESSRGSRER